MELRIAAILGVCSAGLQLFIHLIYVVMSFGGGGGAGYRVMQVVGVLPSVGYLACFIFFLIGFNKLLAPASGQGPS